MGDRTSFVGNLAASAFSASFAEACTIPIDTAKVRLQLQGAAAKGGAKPKYSGMLGTMATVAKEEGVGALWKGLTPALVRQVCYSSMTLVLYEPIRDLVHHGSGEPGYAVRLFAGGTAGAAPAAPAAAPNPSPISAASGSAAS